MEYIENSFFTKDIEVVKWLGKAHWKTNRITDSMNGKCPYETGCAALCLVKGRVDIQEAGAGWRWAKWENGDICSSVNNKNKVQKAPCPRSQESISWGAGTKTQSRILSTKSCTNSNSRLLEYHAPDFFFKLHKEDKLEEIVHFEIKRLCIKKQQQPHSRVPLNSSSLPAFEIRPDFYWKWEASSSAES